jgi:hypothetical protein
LTETKQQQKDQNGIGEASNREVIRNSNVNKDELLFVDLKWIGKSLLII